MHASAGEQLDHPNRHVFRGIRRSLLCLRPFSRRYRDTIESSYRFGASPDNGGLGESWVNSDGGTGWRIVRRFPVIHLDVEFVGEVGVTNHVSWQCPECEVWSPEDVEHDETGHC